MMKKISSAKAIAVSSLPPLGKDKDKEKEKDSSTNASPSTSNAGSPATPKKNLEEELGKSGPFEKSAKSTADEKEKEKANKANNQLLLALSVTKVKMSEWGIVGTITAGIAFGIVELSMSLSKTNTVGSIELITKEVEQLEQQVSEENKDENFEGGEGNDDEEDLKDKKFGSFFKNKVSEGVDKMLHSIRTSGIKMKKSGYSGSVGAVVKLKVFGFGIEIGVEVELSDMEVDIDEDVKKPGSGYLTVQVLEGKNLEASKTGNLNPYVNIRTGYVYKRTKAIPKSLNPVWNEILKLEANINDPVRVRVKDQNLIHKDESLGEQWLNMKTLGLFNGEVQEVVVKDKSGHGEIKMKMAFHFFDTKPNHELYAKLTGGEDKRKSSRNLTEKSNENSNKN